MLALSVHPDSTARGSTIDGRHPEYSPAGHRDRAGQRAPAGHQDAVLTNGGTIGRDTARQPVLEECRNDNNHQQDEQGGRAEDRSQQTDGRQPTHPLGFRRGLEIADHQP